MLLFCFVFGTIVFCSIAKGALLTIALIIQIDLLQSPCDSPMYLRKAAATAIVDNDLNQYTRAKGESDRPVESNAFGLL